MVVGALVGTALGFLGGLGVGGGSLLILYLTLILHMPQAQARVWNLCFFIPCALICSLFRLRQKQLPLKRLWPAILTGSIAAAICTLLGKHTDLTILKKLFGILLVLAGTRELLYKDPPKQL